MKTIEERVRDGATFLDVNVVGWVDLIDVESLYLKSPCRCVLGQLFGAYMTGFFKLEIRHNDDYGFDVHVSEGAGVYDLLTAEWRRFITARRAEQFAPASTPKLATVEA